MAYIKRGDIFYINRFGNQMGSEQHPGRPGIVVSDDENNRYSKTVEVVYCTTREKELLPTHTIVNSTPVQSTVLCEQVTTISVDKLGDYIGKCTPEEMREVDIAVMHSLGLAGSNVKKEREASKVKGSSELLELKAELATYKRLYETLLDKMLSPQKRG